MNRNRMLVLAVIALILSGGVTYLAYRLLQTRLRPPDETVQIVVAAKKLPLGMRLAQEDVQLAQWPRATPLVGSFSDPSLAVGRALMVPVQVNEPILDSKLAPKEAGAGLTAVIPEGMRALTIQVNSIIGVAGFVIPGSRVDLILLGIPPKGVKGARPDEQASKIVLENLEVLAAGQNVQRDVDGKPQSVQDVTLLLTPEQAERVALATSDRIQLALRNPMDQTAVAPPIISRTELYLGPTVEESSRLSAEEARKTSEADKTLAGGGAKKAPPKRASSTAAKKPPTPALAELPPPPKPRVVAVELIQGVKRSTENFEEKKPSEEKKP